MNVLCIWKCYVYVDCIWICYVYGRRRRREGEKEEDGMHSKREPTLSGAVGKNGLCSLGFIGLYKFFTGFNT